MDAPAETADASAPSLSPFILVIFAIFKEKNTLLV